MDSADISIDELRLLRKVSRAVDDLLEESLKARENLGQTFRRLFPEVLALTGARAVAVTTMDEELTVQTFHHGDFGSVFPGTVLSENRWGARRVEGGTLVAQELDVVGSRVGAIGLMFDGDRSHGAEALALVRLLEAVAEELDTVLAAVHTASEKHQLLVRINQLLSNRVFEVGMDQAVLALCEKVKLPGFLLLYRDAVESQALHYRIYRYGHLESSTGASRHPGLDAAIRAHGPGLVGTQDTHLRTAIGQQKVVEAVLISGAGDANPLGKLVVWSKGEGFSAYTMDLLRLLAATLAQRLIDYNRERIHLAQFFSSAVIDDLLKDPEYERKYLTPRAEEVGILFADINGFTRICEQVLERPERIGTFVDDWSEEAVRILHRHGGVFDKMVGDCVIGLFGPPFFRGSLGERAAAAVRAAREIQDFTRDRMSSHREMARLKEILGVPGLGVAIGVNLASTYCGLFGPNRQYTGFSTGMNQAARLQSLGSFRETLVMQSVRDALAASGASDVHALKYGPLQETQVKNVAQPLKYYQLLEG